jgi:ribosomal-protein-alanine N-acetyltransferase
MGRPFPLWSHFFHFDRGRHKTWPQERFLVPAMGAAMGRSHRCSLGATWGLLEAPIATPSQLAMREQNRAAMDTLDPVKLDTPRLLLRPLVDHDAAALLEIHAEPRVMQFSNSEVWTRLEQAKELIEASRSWSSLGTAVCLGIVLKDAAGLLGTCTLFDISRSSRRAEVGFLLGSSAWGRGYMTEALTAFIGYGFGALDLNRMEADTDPRNLAAIRTLERLGFVREGLLRERWITDAQKSDSALFGLLRSDWDAAGRAGTTDRSRHRPGTG